MKKLLSLICLSFLLSANSYAINGNSSVLLDCVSNDNNYHLNVFESSAYKMVLLNLERTSPYALLTLCSSDIKKDHKTSTDYAKKGNGIDAKIVLRFSDENKLIGADLSVAGKKVETLSCLR